MSRRLGVVAITVLVVLADCNAPLSDGIVTGTVVRDEP